ncbi:hypothetical protein HHI36_021454 [Cryptolaemus montrouzieri]|uniref:Adiponectin receptor n=1 Tax=Cryptolaemus montrouzieri TaxID=559131 RepID=A0ABD2MY70_9CUCU
MSHTLSCYNSSFRNVFSKLDYCGISVLITVSFVPWVFYGFYCDFKIKVVYLTAVCLLGATSVVMSWWSKFSKPQWRPFRAGVFMTFGLSGLVPAIHFGVREGYRNVPAMEALGWLFLMGFLYVIGALFYTLRVPERFFPGKFDIWLSSHQIFHVFVLAGTLVHYQCISEMAMQRMVIGQCDINQDDGQDINISHYYENLLT